MLNSIIIRVSGFLVGVLLARTVFGPSRFGLYAVSQIVLAVLLSANELGVSAAIIRWEGDSQHRRDGLHPVYGDEYGVVRRTVRDSALDRTAARLTGCDRMLRVLCLWRSSTLLRLPLALLAREFAQGRRMAVDLLNFGVDPL